MAINSAASRSQGQLHIHVSCIAPVVADFLRRQSEIHGAWSPLRAKLDGHKFLAMKVETESLAQVDPFKLLAARDSVEQAFHPNPGGDRSHVS
jgi:CDP-diacylglycerol pyrophosphatase